MRRRSSARAPGRERACCRITSPFVRMDGPPSRCSQIPAVASAGVEKVGNAQVTLSGAGEPPLPLTGKRQNPPTAHSLGGRRLRGEPRLRRAPLHWRGVYKLLPDNRPDSSVGLTARNHTGPCFVSTAKKNLLFYIDKRICGLVFRTVVRCSAGSTCRGRARPMSANLLQLASAA